MASIAGIILQVALDDLSEISDRGYLDAVTGVIGCMGRRRERLGTIRTENYVEETVHRYSDPLFRAHFRMTRSTFQELLELIGPLTKIRSSISLEQRSLACLWYLSTQETFRSVVDRFGLSKGSLHYFLGNFCRTLTSDKIMPNLIAWPKPEEYSHIAEKNAARGFPGAIGFVDGTYVPIPGPSQFRESYICRKGYPAFHLQGMCDSSLKFIDVFAAYPGSVHDARVYRNCPLNAKLERDPLPEQYHLLGDSAYPLTKSMITPYRDDGHLTNQQKRFNHLHSATRVDIERCFGLLKGTFRKLKYLDMRKVKDIPFVIVSCCVLHNFILDHETYSVEDIDEAEMEDPIRKECTSTETTSGNAKRDSLAALLA